MIWSIFFLLILSILALDLGVFNKNPHIINTKEASKWTAIWFAVSMLFSGVIYWLYGTSNISNPNNLTQTGASLKFITGYLIELSLSVDNIFVIAVIFSSFKIAQKYQHRVLFWGIIGAIFFRGIMIAFGVTLIEQFEWTHYLFGAFLIFTALKMLFSKNDEPDFDPKNSFVYKTLGKIMPITSETDGEKFFIQTKKGKAATTLFVALIVIEVMDVIFALDSVPAILAITSDPFLVFSSNIFAILGLRSMYFFLANMLEKFSYLETSLVFILSFVGIKMIIKEWVEIPEWASLSFIVVSLLVGILVSLKKDKDSKTAK